MSIRASHPAWHHGPRSPSEGGGYIPADTRDVVFARDGADCAYCAVPDATTIDHVYPWAQGGSSDAANLVVACRPCNSIAGLRVFSELATKRAYILFRRTELGESRLAVLYAVAAAEDDPELRGLIRGITESGHAERGIVQ